MILQDSEVAKWAEKLLSYRAIESPRLELIHNYIRDFDPAQSVQTLTGQPNGPLRWLNTNVPPDVKRLATISRVNMLKFVVSGTVQVMYVDGFRAPKSAEEEPAWETWQRNRMDARQMGIHRSAISYGAGYAIVLPGDPVPVIRGASPRRLTAVYEDDEDWPALAIELRNSADPGKTLYRLYDDESTFWLEVSDENGKVEIVDKQEHNVGHVPVVRFLSEVDDDNEIHGDVEPLIQLQDQINVTTFGLLVSQHYQAFRQRYILGWVAPTEQAALTASAKKLWTFEDSDVKVGEFAETNLDGYINSREASLRHLATISQTPAHELLGQLVNLSAEALTAAEATHRRKVLERQTSFGESWEQVLELSGQISGATTDPMAAVRWRDTEARSLSQVADALGKLVLTLGVPPQELWERIPGVTQDEIDRWKAKASEEDAIGQLAAVLDRQSAEGAANAEQGGAE